MGFPGGRVIKNQPDNSENMGNMSLIPGSVSSPWRRKWQPTPGFLLGKSQGQRRLAGYSLWVHKELGTTEQLSMHTISFQ